MRYMCVVIGVCMCIYLYECVRSAHICVSGGRRGGRVGNQQSILEEVMPKPNCKETERLIWLGREV